MNEPRAAKRQSLLMPRGTLSGAIPRPSGIAGPKQSTRPTSVYGAIESGYGNYNGLNGMDFGENGVNGSATDGLASTRAGISTLGRSSTVMEESERRFVAAPGSRVAPGNGLVARSQSVRKPIGSGHSRHMSTSVLGGSRQALPKLTNTSQPQSPVRSHAVDQEQTSSPSRLRAPTSSSHKSSSSISSGGTRLTRANTNSSGISSNPMSSRPTSMMLPPSSRPVFSTLQQHYSPNKKLGPKPTSASIIHSAGGPSSQPTQDTSSGSAALETLFQQAYLLQLICLQASFHPTFEQWCASTRKVLRKKFSDTAARLTVVGEKEMMSRARRNVVALAAWGAGTPVETLDPAAIHEEDWGRLGESIQTLASIIRETTVLVENGGRATVAVGWFTEWIGDVEEVWKKRQEHELDAETEVEFVTDMGTEWREEAAAVLRRLSGLRRMLEGLEKPDTESTVSEVMVFLDSLLRGAIEEMETVVAIEKQVMGLEKEWINEKMEQVMIS